MALDKWRVVLTDSGNRPIIGTLKTVHGSESYARDSAKHFIDEHNMKKDEFRAVSFLLERVK